MKQRLALLVALLVVIPALAASTQSGGSSDAARIEKLFVGTYRLVSFVSFDQSGPRPQDYAGGRISYDQQGRMSAQLMRAGRATLEGTPPTADARAAAYSTYTSYYGTYEIDVEKGAVTHHVESALNPNWVGTPLVRYYKFSDDGKQLLLTVKSGDRVTSTLTWERLP